MSDTGTTESKSEERSLKKLMIVVQETGEVDKGGNKVFQVMLCGDTQRIYVTEEMKLSPAEFWGKKLFQICVGVLQEAGVIRSMEQVQ